MQDLLQDKEESWVRSREEQNGVIMCEGESQKKECVMAALRDEVSALRLQLTQGSQSDQDIKHKLNNLARDIREKKEEIQQLKEQMMEMQKVSGEIVAQTVAEREQRISSLRAQLNNIKSENSKCSALVTSLQKDLSSREKQVLKLAAEVYRLRQDVRYKDAQLSNMATKLSQMKETEKHQEELIAKEKEVESLKKTVERLDVTLREKQKDLKQQSTERDVLTHKLEQMVQDQASLQAEMNRLKVLQHHTLQREEKAQTELKHTRTKVLECLSELAQQKEEFRSKLEELEQKLQKHVENQRLVEEDTEKLKSRLTEWQNHTHKVCLVETIQSQISALQDERVCLAVSWVQTHILTVLTSLHTLLQDTTDRLQEAGMEVSEKTGGVSGAILILCQQYLEIQSELTSLKVEKEQLEERETHAGHLQDRLEVMRQELEHQKFQAAERQSEMEKTVQQQLEMMKTELESARRDEGALRLEMEMRETEWHVKVKESEKREIELRERLREGEQKEEQWREKMKEEEEREEQWGRRMEEVLKRGAEEERERIRVEIEEYREQVRQHAHTIVAMEKQVSTAQQKERVLEDERDSLTQQLTDALSKLEDDKCSISSEQSKEQQQMEHTVTSLRASLEASQQEVVKQAEVITSLSRDLAHAHARLSDLTGELTEQQKLDLETHKMLVVEQRMQLSMHTEKLTTTSQLLEQKDEELKMLREKLENMEVDLRNITDSQENMSSAFLTTQHTKDVALMVSPSDLTMQSSKGKGSHREMLRQQKETLTEMRARIRAVEQKWPSKLLGQQGEPVRQGQMKSHRSQRSAAQRGSISPVSGFAFPEALSEAAKERTARLDMSDALELSERTYVDLAQALCKALEMSEGQFSGCVPLKHVPPAERERLASLRHDDLELFRNRLALQNSQSQNSHLLLQQSQREIQTLRESQAAGQQLQVELDSVCAELEAVKKERDELNQAVNAEGMERRSERVGHHNCIPNDSYDKVAVLKRRRQQDRRRRKETNVDIEPVHKEQAISKMTVQMASLPQQQRSMELTEAH